MGRNDIWVFMSHSSKDYEKVCKVRNELEKRGFRPLMFFLKCLDDKKNDKEVESLIFREIDSRARFILCDSDNAKASDWVKKEVQYIQGKNRFFFTNRSASYIILWLMKFCGYGELCHGFD